MRTVGKVTINKLHLFCYGLPTCVGTHLLTCTFYLSGADEVNHFNGSVELSENSPSFAPICPPQWPPRASSSAVSSFVFYHRGQISRPKFF
ncbi:hypothetical protein TNIN_121271 [Trichonephila inaurata madagascariensis]|uniref:Uncharacterized protein n=1 Tax=Trichonephila inaurata madagascariensis TaxID=2747483 RepID=A0A8X6WNS7_9ARAC|nr:hypothetical protein TNIN_121271 [Trichonephila inaurata madagascariensis]